jgi:hypothetical protein
MGGVHQQTGHPITHENSHYLAFRTILPASFIAVSFEKRRIMEY